MTALAIVGIAVFAIVLVMCVVLWVRELIRSPVDAILSLLGEHNFPSRRRAAATPELEPPPPEEVERSADVPRGWGF